MVTTLHGLLVVLVLGWPGWVRDGAGSSGSPGDRWGAGVAGVAGTSADASQNTVLCPHADVSCNVSLIVGGNIGDTIDANASTGITSTNCADVNCFCSVQYRVFPLEPYVYVKAPEPPTSASPTRGAPDRQQLRAERPAVEWAEVPLLVALYNFMNSQVKKRANDATHHQRTVPTAAEMSLCVVDQPDNLAVDLEENVLALLLNAADPIVSRYSDAGYITKTLFYSKSSMVYNPQKLINNLSFLYTFAVDHLAWNFLFLVLESMLIGALMWYIERGRPGSDFPAHWARGLQHGWYWAVMTFTTVGYGDDVPKSMYGRIVAMIWAISAVLQTALTTSLLINDLSAYSTSSPRAMLLNAAPPAYIGTLLNTTSAGYASHYTSLGDDGVKQFLSIKDACDALQRDEIQAFVADQNVVDYCFVLWDMEKTSFGGFVIGQLESARQEEYVALFSNSTKDVFNSVLDALIPTLKALNVDINDDGAAATLVAKRFSVLANGIVPPRPPNQVNWSPKLVAVMGMLIGLTIMALALPVLLCGVGYKRIKGEFKKKEGWVYEQWVVLGGDKKATARRRTNNPYRQADGLGAELMPGDDDDEYASAGYTGNAVALKPMGASSAEAAVGAAGPDPEEMRMTLNEQRRELDRMLARHKEELDDLVATID